MPDRNYQTIELNWEPLLSLLQNIRLDPSYKAKVFHNSLAHAVLDQSIYLLKHNSFSCIGLTGGVFQNILLRDTTKKLLQDQGFKVITSKTIPANDAGISLGQIMEYGMRQNNDK